ncbi:MULTISPECIES: NADH-quinone oxidoreductase subunit NuoH [Solidesulfovibrio]|jgi:NADH-quinone oxidoreductase subunit H|uniref:NADH-quinone oxidoreductase subunit NuoH n=1 Tax=Solidesulfovibrio TaxID=2910984 RepID=UPI0004979B09|nr:MULTISPECIES: NADH-quinone oxidoreductase subunit NuoH [Solidesulfovibrio]MEA5089157.1 NADH-quinone oxidoreductase subunit NuoH [Solidesulfovibrio sp.]HCR12152.1 NADH-quinone oxidoreductase subunit NuoH [Desulfovibrio sp.]HML60465.1 NADH-quinone oxidoreductase subunit NuoH [Solidesulfovibrio sp.]
MNLEQLLSLDYPLTRLVIGLLCIFAFVGLNGLVLVWVERKVAGHCQLRPGPLHVGPHGLLQPLVDAVKLIGKQLVAPFGSDKALFWLAPLLAFAPVTVCMLPLPWGPDMAMIPMNTGLVLILAFSGLGVLSLILAGWGSNNKWGLLGAARSVAQSVAYEVPLLLSVMAVAITAGSLDLFQISAQQGGWPWQWYGVKNPLAFFIFLVCAVAETNRAPFDLPEAESELTAGFHTEYSGMGFGLFFLAEYANMIIVSGVAAALFLGGWQGPFLPGVWWFLVKIYCILFFIIWLRWTYPRVRFDQLLNLSWKWLTPLALLDLALAVIVAGFGG